MFRVLTLVLTLNASKTSMLTHITDHTEPAETVTDKLDKIADDANID